MAASCHECGHALVGPTRSVNQSGTPVWESWDDRDDEVILSNGIDNTAKRNANSFVDQLIQRSMENVQRTPSVHQPVDSVSDRQSDVDVNSRAGLGIAQPGHRNDSLQSRLTTCSR